MLDEHPFALCLTHDVDRPYKSYRALYYAVTERALHHVGGAVAGHNPYWQFERLMALEDDLGVRSAFYFLNEPHLLEKGPRAWLRPVDWVQHLGRYDIEAPTIVDVIRDLDAGGWEVGLHGSFRSHVQRERLRHEKARLERVLGHEILGGRQHYLNLEIPTTWRHHAAIGLAYDASLGSSTAYGFRHGYHPLQPFDDRFVVFPLTLMEQALPDPAERFDAAAAACDDLLDEAADHAAVMTVLWHPRYFSESDFPGHARLYRRLIERALDRGAWVGPPGDLYCELESAGYLDAGARNTEANKGPAGRQLSENLA